MGSSKFECLLCLYNCRLLISCVLVAAQCSGMCLPSSKACAVAQETLVMWCSLASGLGVSAVQAELEDFCFAVLQMNLFCYSPSVHMSHNHGTRDAVSVLSYTMTLEKVLLDLSICIAGTVLESSLKISHQ
jgi:(p)ppGpp synthase/HD superfamily hydrolase